VKPRGEHLRTRVMMLSASSHWCRSFGTTNPRGAKAKAHFLTFSIVVD